VEQIKGDWRKADLDDKTKAMLVLSEKITENAAQIEAKDIESLREKGFSDNEILDVVLIACFFNYMDRLADTLGVELDRHPSTVEG
jgi:uncharacterized peroxidase-related enzyme